ncbi:pilus assembly FimT family protein [Granulibacter bethesdensis]|uniref:pilus assembly FimT family protein n=1 Tax=Granulibacter bethesdensis TaxID=364410 RepID=UPI00090C2350|nr:GspH/FimT family pseudopilin [Granulibacter bethesdensis]APH60117.1 General secretion pathway protein H [Granulibacter bethesdensis]
MKKQSSTSAHREAGFTLLEMLVVLAILGVGTGIALLYGTRTPDGLKARDAARAIAIEFRLARSQAIWSGHTVRVTADLDHATLQRDNAMPVQLRGVTLHHISQDSEAAKQGDDTQVTLLFLPHGGAKGDGLVVSAGHTFIDVRTNPLTGAVNVVP